MAIKFRQVNFKDGNPYSGGPCILEDRSVAWAAMSVGDDGRGGKVARLIEDRRPTARLSYSKPKTGGPRRI